MSYCIEFGTSVRKDFKKLGLQRARVVHEVILKKLKIAPLRYGEYLHQPLYPHRKLRIGDVRVVYRVDKDNRLVTVLVVGMRKNAEVYRKAEKRIRK
jgi:mRNA-degrading endonuclease RelE of RelBE toxin-antitoxin system